MDNVWITDMPDIASILYEARLCDLFLVLPWNTGAT
jgi:hypothetical protein